MVTVARRGTLRKHCEPINTMTTPCILALGGSLRRESFNQKLAAIAVESARSVANRLGNKIIAPHGLRPKQNMTPRSELFSGGASSFVVIAGLFLNNAGTALGANPVFQGTFTEQITSTGDTNLYYVGETFTGYYQYLAPSPDGAFATDTSGNLGSGNWTNFTLDGQIYLPFSKETSFIVGGTTIQYNYGPGGEQIGLTQTPNGGALTILNSHATQFNWSYDNGGFYFQMNVGSNGIGSFEALSFYDTPGILTTSGTIQFGDPVPEPRVTALWFAGLAGASVIRLTRLPGR